VQAHSLKAPQVAPPKADKADKADVQAHSLKAPQVAPPKADKADKADVQAHVMRDERPKSDRIVGKVVFNPIKDEYQNIL